jgi:drug/metabolite transporter (DMT)-like permease
MTGWLVLAAIGVIGLVAQLMMTRAYALGDAATISVYGYLTPVFAALGGLLWFGEPLTPQVLIGTGLVAVAGWWAR